MKTFFHPDAPSTAVPLAKVALDRLMGSIQPFRKFCEEHARATIAAGSLCIAGLAVAAVASSDSKMPGLIEVEGKELPSKVEQAAREVFDGRFAKDGESYYTIIVHYVPNHASEMKGFNALMGATGGIEPVAPLVTLMELIEIRDLRTEIEPVELKRHDELNKITWKGKVLVKGGVERRRTLDLTAWLKTVSEGEHFAAIPWMAKPVTLEDAKMEKGKSDSAGDAMEMMGALMTMFTPDFKQELLNCLKGDGWRDWEECGKICYQSSYVTLRDGEVSYATSEDMDSTLGGKPEVSLMALHSNNLLHIGAMDGADDSVFLTKPDMKALRKAGITK